VRAWLILCRILIALVGCAVILALAAVGFAAGVDAGMFRGLVIRFISAKAERPIQVAGALHVHLLARHPDLVAERVTIGNPSWVPPGSMAEIGEASMAMDVPWFQRAFGIASLSMKSATLHLMRDASGYANWQWRNPDAPPSTKKIPILRRLSIPDARVLLDDERRHLKFDGVVSVQGADGGATSPLTIAGSGQLNGHPDSFEITSDPLAAASHEIPYHFSFSEHSSGSELKGRGSLPKPFDFQIIDASFDARGADLRDLYFLTGVSLINSGTYQLTGNIFRRGKSTRFADLAATTGQSDIRGAVAIDASGGRPRLDIDLDSRFLRMADFGLRAAGRAPDTGQPPLLLSNAALNPPTLRRDDADIRFRVKRLQIGRATLSNVAGRGTLERGVLTAAPLTAEILGGKLHSKARLDARSDNPKTSVDMTIADLQLAEIDHKNPSAPPATGLLQVRIAITGVGRSIHQVAASANGTVAAIVRQGTVRDSLAEMTGVDLRGLGLVASKSQKETPLRCAVAEFEDRDGTLTAKRLVADTDPVLITGEGQIHFDTETLDLAISGHPKSVRLLRFRAPVLVKGTLTHPSIDVQARKFTLVDPGNAKDADCAALESEAGPEH
jgi:uncharacterized protein involved in outer membrane biogenesis